MKSLKLKLPMKNLWAISFTLTVASCTTAVIKDSEWCGDIGSEGAMCFHTLTTDSRRVKPFDWDAERQGMLCTKPATFADWKINIEELCHKNTKCVYQLTNGVPIIAPVPNAVPAAAPAKVKKALKARAAQKKPLPNSLATLPVKSPQP